MSTPWNPPASLLPHEERLCKKLEKHRRFFRFLRLHRTAIFADGFQEQLASLYSDCPRGTPPKPPAQLALALLLQAYSGVSDDDVILLTETDLRWQMVLDCWGAESAPFKKSTFVDFRSRLVRSRFADALLRRTVELALQSNDFDPKKLKPLRVALDSFPLEGAGRVEDSLNLLARALRVLVATTAAFLAMPPQQIYAEAGLRILAASSPKTGMDRDWDRPGSQEEALNDLLLEVDHMRVWMTGQRMELHQQRVVNQAQEQLQRVLEQNAEARAIGGFRFKQEVAVERQLSLFDPEIRHGRKSKTQRIDGYKVYVAQEMTHDVTLAVAVLPANQHEKHGADRLREAVCSYAEVEQLHVDRGFLNSVWVTEKAAQAVDSVVCRAPAIAPSPYYNKRDFLVDFERQIVRCPAGKEAPIEQKVRSEAAFGAKVCRPCSQRSACQNPKTNPGRRVILVPSEALLRHANQQTKTREGRAALRERVVVEHANARMLRRYGKKARYRGIEKNDLDAARIAAVNNLMLMDRTLRTRSIPRPIAQAA